MVVIWLTIKVPITPNTRKLEPSTYISPTLSTFISEFATVEQYPDTNHTVISDNNTETTVKMILRVLERIVFPLLTRIVKYCRSCIENCY